jgi:excisionase family DNA binding protein
LPNFFLNAYTAKLMKLMNTTSTKQPCASIEGGKSATVKQGALKLKDACEYLGGISASSVRRLIKRNLLTPNRTLRHILIPTAELDRFLMEGQR